MLWLDHEEDDPLEVEVEDEDFPATVEVEDEDDEVLSELVLVLELVLTDSVENEEVEDEDEEDIDTSTVEELDVLLDDSSSSTTSVTSNPVGAERPRIDAATPYRSIISDTSSVILLTS